jgi:hypothetical protein
MADGSEKRADQLAEGDVIAVMTLGGLKPATIYMVTKSVVTNYLAYQVTFSDGTVLTASENHTVLNDDEELVTLESLALGEPVRKSDGQLVRVTAKEMVGHERLELINVIVNVDSMLAIDHVYITNGLFSGDWLLQTTRDSREETIELLWDTVDLSHVPQKTSSENNSN